MVMEADKEELITLRKQVEDLHKTIQEKDEILQSVENLNSQISCGSRRTGGVETPVCRKGCTVESYSATTR